MAKSTILNSVSPSQPSPESREISQLATPVEVTSPQGYSLKHPFDWQRFSTQVSDPNSDIFIGKSFSDSPPGFTVIITTTMRDFLETPRELPPTVKRFDKVVEIYTAILAQTGYRITDIREVMINEIRGFRLVTEKPEKRASITVILEGKDEKMIVSTANFPIDSTVITNEKLEQVVQEIDSIQNSIAILQKK